MRRDNAPKLFLSNLSGADFWMLRQAGYCPVGLAIGNCAYYRVGDPAIARRANRWTPDQSSPLGMGFGVNMERSDYTHGLYNARNIAVGRMEDEARAVGAEGVVGVTVEVDTRSGGSADGQTMDMFCHFVVIGTAIARQPGRQDVPDITTNLSLK